jgi:FMN phosphatase YigB (HAD superfamily)
MRKGDAEERRSPNETLAYFGDFDCSVMEGKGKMSREMFELMLEKYGGRSNLAALDKECAAVALDGRSVM